MLSLEAVRNAHACGRGVADIETACIEAIGAVPVPWRDWRPSPAIRASLLLHAVAAGSLLADWEGWPWALGSVAANHIALTAFVMLPRNHVLGTNLTRLPEARRQAGHVALTFDDGPDPQVTPAVLDRRGATASFFCIGAHARRHPGLVREIVRRGHQVENHTYDHPSLFACFGPAAMRREVLRAQDVLADITGRPPAWFRAPLGLRSPLLDAALAGTGLRHASWTRRGYDTVSTNPATVLTRLCRGLAAGDVVLLHDGSGARGPGGDPVILAVLPRLLDRLAGLGLAATGLEPPVGQPGVGQPGRAPSLPAIR